MAATSTNIDTRYLASAFIPSILVEDPDVENQNPQLEIFASSMVKACKLIQPQSLYQYTRERVPVIARRLLGNTSCWWMIMLASGQNNALLIEPGEYLIIPDINAIRAALLVQDNNTSRIPRYTLI